MRVIAGSLGSARHRHPVNATLYAALKPYCAGAAR